MLILFVLFGGGGFPFNSLSLLPHDPIPGGVGVAGDEFAVGGGGEEFAVDGYFEAGFAAFGVVVEGTALEAGDGGGLDDGEDLALDGDGRGLAAGGEPDDDRLAGDVRGDADGGGEGVFEAQVDVGEGDRGVLASGPCYGCRPRR